MDMTAIAIQAGVGLLGLLLYAVAWRSVGSLPALAKWVLRIFLGAVILVPFALLILRPDLGAVREASKGPDASPPGRHYKKHAQDKKEAAPRTEERETAAAPEPRPVPSPTPPAVTPPSAPQTGPMAPQSTPSPDPIGSGGAAAPSSPAPEGTRGLGQQASPPPGASRAPEMAPPGSSAGAPPPSGGGARSADDFTPPPRPPAAANGESKPRMAEPDAARSAPKPAAAEAPAPVPTPESGDWTVVPVYYGTDRERAANDKRLDYASGRGRRLELGRAMVTVPKEHEVPQIERPWAIKIPYFNVTIYEQKEDPKVHFTMQDIKALSEAELLDLVKQRLAKSARFKDHAFVFVHGYNTSFDYAIYRAAQIAYDIKFDGAPFVYSWPSGGGIASYTYDRESSAQAEPYLEQFLRFVMERSGAKTVSLIAHSMGNQLLLRVLQDLKRQKPEGVEISQIILAAPDVDRDSFENIATSIKGLASGGITLYAAANDRALDVSRRFHGGIPRAGDVPGGVPLVLPGIDTIDATAVSMDSLGLHHSGYAESNALLSDIGLLIQTGERPPEKRVPILKRVPTDKGDFWRYPSSR
ncbi:MAG: alpha/beta hydrolase [Hyphomicrobiaceae bacterium]